MQINSIIVTQLIQSLSSCGAHCFKSDILFACMIKSGPSMIASVHRRAPRSATTCDHFFNVSGQILNRESNSSFSLFLNAHLICLILWSFSPSWFSNVSLATDCVFFFFLSSFGCAPSAASIKLIDSKMWYCLTYSIGWEIVSRLSFTI